METQHSCQICNSKFKPIYEAHIYCSDDCREKVRVLKCTAQIFEKGGGQFKIFERDGFKCAYCGKSSYKDGVKLVIDHLYPTSKGGKTVLDNLITCCSKCNIQKSNSIIRKEAMSSLLKEVITKNNDCFTYEDQLEIIKDLRKKNILFKDDYKPKALR